MRSPGRLQLAQRVLLRSPCASWVVGGRTDGRCFAEAVEAQSGEATCPGSLSPAVGQLELDPVRPPPEPGPHIPCGRFLSCQAAFPTQRGEGGCPGWAHPKVSPGRLGSDVCFLGLPSAQSVKNLSAMQETRVRFLDREDLLEKGMATHSVSLPGQSHGQRSLAGYSPRGGKSRTRVSD